MTIDILSPRLRLTPYIDADASDVYAAIIDNTEHLSTYIGLYALREKWDEDPMALLDLLRGKGRGIDKLELAIRDRNSNRLLGGASIIRAYTEGVPTELGYWLLRDSLGQGYATEAVGALTETLLDTHPEVILEIEISNKASLRLADRLGYQVVGPCEIPWPDGIPRPGLRMVKTQDME